MKTIKSMNCSIISTIPETIKSRYTIVHQGLLTDSIEIFENKSGKTGYKNENNETFTYIDHRPLAITFRKKVCLFLKVGNNYWMWF